MLKPTTVWTWDYKNDKFYSTTDKLYLGVAGNWQDTYFAVGTNKIDTSGGKAGNYAVYNGLKVGLNAAIGPEGSPYITEKQSTAIFFWLRSPHADITYNALIFGTGPAVSYGDGSVGDGVPNGRCAPACALNLSNLLFASAAKPETETTGTLSDGVYLRMKDVTGNPRISTTATVSGDTLTVNKGLEVGRVYLMVQGNDGTNDWAYSKKIKAAETITAGDGIHNGLTSFDNCQIWLETTDDNVTYAKEVKTAAPAEMKSFINAAALKKEDTKYGLFGSASTTPTLTVEFEKIPVYSTLNGLPRVLSGVGGDAGYRYNLNTGDPEFYCKPEPGYKLESITIGADGTKYVKFKMV